MDDRVLRMNDEAAIRRVIDRYCHAVDRGDADDVAALFCEEGTLLATFEEDGRYKGRAAVRQWYADYHANYRAKLAFLRHKVASVLIDLDGDTARAVTYLDADCAPRDEPSRVLRGGGRYDDKFVRVGDSWLFDERAIVINWADDRLTALLHGE